MMGWGGGMGMGMPFFGIGPLLLIVIVVGVVIFWTRQTQTSGDGSHGPTTREILDRRYASGEISKEQYDQMKRDLA
jgi:putative membrane protein